MKMADIERASKGPTDQKTVVEDDSFKASIAVGQENLASVTTPHESFEGYHRFDPSASWTAKEERAVIFKTDLLLLSWVCVMVCMLPLAIEFSY
jgi:hypothetical protein